MFITDYNQHLLDNVKKIHFIGCGGSGMYPLIQILAAKGYEISGSRPDSYPRPSECAWASGQCPTVPKALRTGRRCCPL